jgi:hypothetical protein
VDLRSCDRATLRIQNRSTHNGVIALGMHRHGTGKDADQDDGEFSGHRLS